MPQWAPPIPPKIIPWSAIAIAVLLTVDLGYEWLNTQQEIASTEQRVQALTTDQQQLTEQMQRIPERKIIEQQVTVPPDTAHRRKKGGRSRAESGASEHTEDTVIVQRSVSNPEHQQVQRQLQDTSMEIEAQGFRLKILNEASWSMIIKLCTVWAFLLITLFLYRYWSYRLITK